MIALLILLSMLVGNTYALPGATEVDFSMLSNSSLFDQKYFGKCLKFQDDSALKTLFNDASKLNCNSHSDDKSFCECVDILSGVDTLEGFMDQNKETQDEIKERLRLKLLAKKSQALDKILDSVYGVGNAFNPGQKTSCLNIDFFKKKRDYYSNNPEMVNALDHFIKKASTRNKTRNENIDLANDQFFLRSFIEKNPNDTLMKMIVQKDVKGLKREIASFSKNKEFKDSMIWQLVNNTPDAGGDFATRALIEIVRDQAHTISNKQYGKNQLKSEFDHIFAEKTNFQNTSSSKHSNRSNKKLNAIMSRGGRSSLSSSTFGSKMGTALASYCQKLNNEVEASLDGDLLNDELDTVYSQFFSRGDSFSSLNKLMEEFKREKMSELSSDGVYLEDIMTESLEFTFVVDQLYCFEKNKNKMLSTFEKNLSELDKKKAIKLRSNLAGLDKQKRELKLKKLNGQDKIIALEKDNENIKDWRNQMQIVKTFLYNKNEEDGVIKFHPIKDEKFTDALNEFFLKTGRSPLYGLTGEFVTISLSPKEEDKILKEIDQGLIDSAELQRETLLSLQRERRKLTFLNEEEKGINSKISSIRSEVRGILGSSSGVFLKSDADKFTIVKNDRNGKFELNSFTKPEGLSVNNRKSIRSLNDQYLRPVAAAANEYSLLDKKIDETSGLSNHGSKNRIDRYFSSFYSDSPSTNKQIKEYEKEQMEKNNDRTGKSIFDRKSDIVDPQIERALSKIDNLNNKLYEIEKQKKTKLEKKTTGESDDEILTELKIEIEKEKLALEKLKFELEIEKTSERKVAKAVLPSGKTMQNYAGLSGGSLQPKSNVASGQGPVSVIGAGQSISQGASQAGATFSSSSLGRSLIGPESTSKDRKSSKRAFQLSSYKSESALPDKSSSIKRVEVSDAFSELSDEQRNVYIQELLIENKNESLVLLLPSGETLFIEAEINKREVANIDLKNEQSKVKKKTSSRERVKLKELNLELDKIE